MTNDIHAIDYEWGNGLLRTEYTITEKDKFVKIGVSSTNIVPSIAYSPKLLDGSQEINQVQ